MQDINNCQYIIYREDIYPARHKIEYKKSMITPRNIVVTGGNSGIGYQTVKSLYEQGHHVIFGSRSVAKNQEAMDKITQQQGGSLLSFPLDLSSRKSIQQFANNVKSKFDHIDILVNNAGLMLQQKQNSQIGYQMTLTINHFGPFYLTYLLWGLIVKAQQARIINVSSQAHYYAPSRHLEDLQCSNKSYGAFSQYSISKLYNVLFTRGLNDLINRHGLKNIKTASLHPGTVTTNFGRDSRFIKCIQCLCCCIVRDQVTGARCSLYLCRAPLSQILSGEYYNEDTRYKEMDRRGRNQKDVETLWALSEKAYGVTFQ